jgi:hypothetical protein
MGLGYHGPVNVVLGLLREEGPVFDQKQQFKYSRSSIPCGRACRYGVMPCAAPEFRCQGLGARFLVELLAAEQQLQSVYEVVYEAIHRPIDMVLHANSGSYSAGLFRRNYSTVFLSLIRSPYAQLFTMVVLFSVRGHEVTKEEEDIKGGL